MTHLLGGDYAAPGHLHVLVELPAVEIIAGAYTLHTTPLKYFLDNTKYFLDTLNTS